MRAALHIGEVADLLGVSQKTIRHHHKVGLLAEPARSQGGYRLYTASDLMRLLRIRRLQALGLSLKQIKGILGAPDQERPLREVLGALLADLSDQIVALERRRARIQHLLAEETLAAIDAPAEMPALLQWAQTHLKDQLPQASAEVWQQDAQIFGLLEAFHWPGDTQEQMKAAIKQAVQQSELIWLFRRRRPDGQVFTYHKQSIFGVLLIAALFSSPVEILLFELLIPWTWLRWALLIASLYTLIWIVGYYASLAVRPHRLEAEGIRLRYGALADGFISYAAIKEVARKQQKALGKSRGLLVDAGASAAYFGMDGTTNVMLRLDSPQPLRGFFTVTAPVATIYLAVDEPERFVRAVRQRLEMADAASVANAQERVRAS